MADIRSGYVLNLCYVYHGTFPESKRSVRLNKWEPEEQSDHHKKQKVQTELFPQNFCSVFQGWGHVYPDYLLLIKMMPHIS